MASVTKTGVVAYNLKDAVEPADTGEFHVGRLHSFRVPHADRQVSRVAFVAAATELGAIAVREAVARAGVEPADVDEVIMGNVLSAGVGQAPARQAALRAGSAADGRGAHGQQSLRVGIESGDARRAGSAVRRRRSGRRGRHGKHEPGRVCCCRAMRLRPAKAPMIDSMLYDGLTCPFSKQSMGEIADDLAASGRHFARGAGSLCAGKPSPRDCGQGRSGAFADEIVPVTVRRGHG